MTHRDFTYWLKGFEELVKDIPTVEQWEKIREHLRTCFNCEIKAAENLPSIDGTRSCKKWIESDEFKKTYPQFNSDQIAMKRYFWGSEDKEYFTFEQQPLLETFPPDPNLFRLIKYMPIASC